MTCEAVTHEFIFHTEQHVFSLLLTSDCAVRMRSIEGKAVSCRNQCSSRHLLSLGIQDNNSGKKAAKTGFGRSDSPENNSQDSPHSLCLYSEDGALSEGASCLP